VDESCISCGRIDTLKFFLMDAEAFGAVRIVHAPSCRPSLVSIDRRAHNRCSRPICRSIFTVAAAIHRFEESIGGRAYLIEVANVSQNRWRAYIVRIPGVPTALMPFYGSTPTEAAQLLSDWLTKAHARAATGAGSV
jgi:hypothetical protein